MPAQRADRHIICQPYRSRRYLQFSDSGGVSMEGLIDQWGQAALTTASFFWIAFWAFGLGYVISSAITVFVTRERMRRTMGKAGPKSVTLATVFGFVSSSCSFAAIAAARSLFQKGAGIVPALAFLLASTNLVIELGIVIAIFLSWQFVVGEYLGGLILILVMWLLVRLTLPKHWEESARKHAEDVGGGASGEIPDWRKLMKSLRGWTKVARQYFMEWGMVWKDVSFGFTIAGIIAVFVPTEFFQFIFIGSGDGETLDWWEIVLHTVIGPVAAFFTFIGSMGNIPLAAVLYTSGVSFAGIMAFIFSDLVVFPVLRIMSGYFGWRMALYILGIFLLCIIVAAVSMHYGFALLGLLPEVQTAGLKDPSTRFEIDYTFFFNLFFLLVSAFFGWLVWRARGKDLDASAADARTEDSSNNSEANTTSNSGSRVGDAESDRDEGKQTRDAGDESDADADADADADGGGEDDQTDDDDHSSSSSGSTLGSKVLTTLAVLSLIWVGTGIAIWIWNNLLAAGG
ncbi:MAG: permease [Planctomycetota bacterium]